MLFGAFQRGDLFEPSAARWNELARVARTTVVFADAWDDSPAAPGLVRATLAPDAPLRREWAVVCDARDSTAVLSAWELPGQERVTDSRRVFEAIWTVDPAAVRDAARVAAAVAAEAGTVEARSLLPELAAPPAAPAAVAPVALFNRVLAYVDRGA